MSGAELDEGLPSGAFLEDDSPFIRPASPSTSAQPYRPSPDVFRGFGSMRMGTQTLIQALQALPFDHENDEDVGDIPTPLPSVNDSNSDEDDDEEDYSLQSRMGASLLAIHRPFEWSKRVDKPGSKSGPALLSSPTDYFSSSRSGHDSGSDGNAEYDQDDDPTPGSSQLIKARDARSSLTSRPVAYLATSGRIHSQRHSDDLFKRRTQLADKLKDVFDLAQPEEVLAEIPCWLLRSVLLQGFMYLTTAHLCFFAHVPAREGQVIKSAFLNKKATRTKRWTRQWFALKDDALSWYHSSSDPYFPHGVVDLRYALSCEPLRDKELRIRTNERTITIAADSQPSREEWVKAIKRSMFKAQNTGESVKISIPYSAVLDVEISRSMDFSESIEVKVPDAFDHIAMDSYLFAHFRDIQGALDQIRDAVRMHRTVGEPQLAQLAAVRDSTLRHSEAIAFGAGRLPAPLTSSASAKSPSGIFRLTSLLRPFSHSEHTAVTNRAARTSSLTGSAGGLEVTEGLGEPRDFSESPSTTSPPATSFEQARAHEDNTNSTWGVGMPSWLRVPSRSAFTFSTVSSSSRVSEVYTKTVSTHVPVDIGYSVLISESGPDPEIMRKFRDTFAPAEKEVLLGYVPGSILRMLPTPGLLMISTSQFCFRSSGKLASRTRMVLPLRDILSTQHAKPFRYGQHGLVVIIRGHEELFFEFSSVERRAAFVSLLEHQMEHLQTSNSDPRPGHAELMTAQIETAATIHEDDWQASREAMSGSLPTVMFTSASSTFLTFKPSESLHFTFLTIGSRGDVQPYIALAKGLLADGHRVRIATHAEYKQWIELFGIEFGAVGGDPGELLRICVENGMFTVSFLRETLQNFRGWLDDLLASAWEACQGTDVLVESPSAMAGIHIAEALGIPYFRAFTMPWSRTRAYPHAFAVPDQKMGGTYNYMSYVMFDQVFWRATAGQINRWRRNMLKIRSTSLDQMEQHKVPFLYNFSPTIVPAPLDWPEWIKVSGYWFLDDADPTGKKWTPPLDLVQFLTNARTCGKKLVYIGFGSVVVSDPDAMTRTVVDAVLESGVHAVLSKGWSDRFYVRKEGDAIEPPVTVPKEIYSIAALPHDWLFSRIDAVCHHGGAGTTGASLRAGIPTIIRPFFGDQFFWGDRVEALGIGTCLRSLTVETLAQALVLATTDQKRIDKARVIGKQIRSENGVDNAIETIYRDLDYARFQVKRRQQQPVGEVGRGAVDTSAIGAMEVGPEGVANLRVNSAEHEGDAYDLQSEGEWSVISDPED